jgi:hypothetical protein
MSWTFHKPPDREAIFRELCERVSIQPHVMFPCPQTQPASDMPHPPLNEPEPFSKDPVNWDTIPGSKLDDEEWREYKYGGSTVRITNPKRLQVGKTCHRVLDADGLVHCVPAPGHFGCELVWKPRSLRDWCQF